MNSRRCRDGSIFEGAINANHHAEIDMFYLPSHSPELNPDECLSADLKEGVTKRSPARSKSQLK